MEFYAWFVTFTVSLPVHGDSIPRDDSSQQGASAVSRLHPPSAANYRRSLYVLESYMYLLKDYNCVFNEMVVLNRS